MEQGCPMSAHFSPHTVIIYLHSNYLSKYMTMM